MQRLARTIRQDLEAVRNAVLEPWSNGQTEGQINKLKTLKRAMYGRADVDLLRARMIPLQEGSLHQGVNQTPSRCLPSADSVLRDEAFRTWRAATTA